jgi:HD-like signal output (HDOD) protein
MFNRFANSPAAQARSLEARVAVSRRYVSLLRSLPAAPLNFAQYGSWASLPSEAELDSLRVAAFTAEGRTDELNALWRETLATALCTRRVASVMGADAKVCTAAALLHRVGDALALVALAKSEDEAGVRLDAPSRAELCGRESAEVAGRALRWWCVPPPVATVASNWRRFGEFAAQSKDCAAVYLAHLLAIEWQAPEICAPGLVDSVGAELQLSAAAMSELRPDKAAHDLWIQHGGRR